MGSTLNGLRWLHANTQTFLTHGSLELARPRKDLSGQAALSPSSADPLWFVLWWFLPRLQHLKVLWCLLVFFQIILKPCWWGGQKFSQAWHNCREDSAQFPGSRLGGTHCVVGFPGPPYHSAAPLIPPHSCPAPRGWCPDPISYSGWEGGRGVGGQGLKNLFWMLRWHLAVPGTCLGERKRKGRHLLVLLQAHFNHPALRPVKGES